MAGGKKLDVIKLADRREKKLNQAQKYLDKIRALQIQAEELDTRIYNNCEHPKEHLKIEKFTREIPQSSIWLCKLCYQIVDTEQIKEAKAKLHEKIEKDIAVTHANTKPKGPSKAIQKIKVKKKS